MLLAKYYAPLAALGLASIYHRKDGKISCCESSSIEVMTRSRVASRSGRYVVVGSDGIAGETAVKLLQGIVPSWQVIPLKSHPAVVKLDIASRLLYLEDGDIVGFGDCLIATGRYTHSFNPIERLGELEGSFDPLLFERGHAMYLDDPDCLEKLKEKVCSGAHVTLIGGSTMEFRTLETALVLAEEGKKSGYLNMVSVLCPSTGVLSQMVPRYLSMALNKRLNAMGVEVIRYAQIRYVAGMDAVTHEHSEEDQEEDEGKPAAPGESSPLENKPKIAVFCSHAYDGLQTASFETDVVALSGVSQPVGRGNGSTNGGTGSDSAEYDDSEHWAIKAGLEKGTIGGIVANRSLQAAAGIWVAGDIANVDIGQKSIGRGVWAGADHAVQSGTVAARNMLGGSEMYDYLPANHLVCLTTACTDNSKGDGAGAAAAAVVVPHVSLTTVGHCSAAQESHGFWWAKSTHEGERSSGDGSSTIRKGEKRSSSSSSSGGGSGGDNGSGRESKETPLSQVIQDQLLGYLGARRGNGGDDGAPSRSEDMKIKAKGRRASRHISSGSSSSSSSSGSSTKDRKKKKGKSQEGKPKQAPTKPPLGKGIVFYVHNNVITGVLLSGLIPTVHQLESNEGVSTDHSKAYARLELERAEENYHTLVENSKKLIGVNVESYLDLECDTSSVGLEEGATQTQAVFLFGNPSGKRYISTASQLESLACSLLQKHTETTVNGSILANINMGDGNEQEQFTEVSVTKPQYRHLRASMELQRSIQSSTAITTVTPQPALKEKLTSGTNSGNSTYSSKDRVKAAYGTALKGTDLVKGAWVGGGGGKEKGQE